MSLTHFDEAGNAQMVDVTDKMPTERVAVAEGYITFSEAIGRRIQEGQIRKGDVLSVAQLAAIMGAKQTSNLIPLCHPLPITKVKVQCELMEQLTSVKVTATVKTLGLTGVEMEALTAVQIGLLTVYDMCKAMDKGMVIGPTYLVEKQGGKSGHYVRRTTEE